jgi:hypothetical protein
VSCFCALARVEAAEKAFKSNPLTKQSATCSRIPFRKGYAQIGGLLLATIVTKLQVPVMYAIFVLDLKILKWETKPQASGSSLSAPALNEGKSA